MPPPSPPPEHAESWVADAAGDVEVLQARYVGHRFAPHAHEGYAVGVVDAGAIDFGHGRRTVSEAGTVSLVNPGEVHAGRAATEAGWAYTSVHVSARLVGRVWRDLGGAGDLPAFARPVDGDPAVFRGLSAWVGALGRGADRLASESATEAALASLLSRCGRTAPDAVPPGPEATRAKEFLDARFADRVGLDDVAAAAELSRWQVLRAFRAAYGLTPHAYVTGRRVEAAKARLCAGERPVRVALACGFADQSHLSRRFKEIVGVPPGRFARPHSRGS